LRCRSSAHETGHKAGGDSWRWLLSSLYKDRQVFIGHFQRRLTKPNIHTAMRRATLEYGIGHVQCDAAPRPAWFKLPCFRVTRTSAIRPLAVAGTLTINGHGGAMRALA
jgi:hypothetical protein